MPDVPLPPHITFFDQKQLIKDFRFYLLNLIVDPTLSCFYYFLISALGYIYTMLHEAINRMTLYKEKL